MERIKLDTVTDEEREALHELERDWGARVALAYRFSRLIEARVGVPYVGTVPAHVKADRRRKDKVARRSRRVNRRTA